VKIKKAIQEAKRTDLTYCLSISLVFSSSNFAPATNYPLQLLPGHNRLQNDPFIDTKIYKVLKIPFYRHLDALCLQKDFFEIHQIVSKKDRFWDSSDYFKNMKI
jgi:hypothetical protein